MSPTVSIILPTFNRPQYIPDTVASIFAQTYRDWELLITDDGSDDDTRAYLQTLVDAPRVRLLQRVHTGRPAVVRNAALREARGIYVAFMDSDDLWMPTKLETQVNCLQSDNSREWSHTGFVLCDRQGNDRPMPAADGWILKELLEARTVIALPSVVVSRRLLERVGGFDESLVMCEDYDLWLRMAALTRIVAIDEPLTRVRRHGEHYGNSTLALQDGLRVLDKVLDSSTEADHVASARKARATYAAMLAKRHTTSGRRLEGLTMLFLMIPVAWRYPRWWRVALDAAVAALVPLRVRYHLRRRARALSSASRP
jgi:glycosyltransferase involved in cell wall biosynthesis